MSLKEIDRAWVLKKVLDGYISLTQAALELGVCYSHIKRLNERFT